MQRCNDLVLGFIYFFSMQDSWDPDWQSTCSSKIAYLVERLKQIQATNKLSDCSMDKANYGGVCDFVSREELCARQNNGSSETPAQKVLIFSQFLEHIHVIEQQVKVVRYAITLHKVCDLLHMPLRSMFSSVIVSWPLQVSNLPECIVQ